MFSPNCQWCNINPSFCSTLFSQVCTFSPPPTGVPGETAVSGQRRPSVTPPTLTAVWKSSLTRTALLYQHTVSRWVCLSSPQSLLCHSNHSRPCLWAIAEYSLARPHVISCNISRIEKITSGRGAEVGVGAGMDGGGQRGRDQLGVASISFHFCFYISKNRQSAGVTASGSPAD